MSSNVKDVIYSVYRIRMSDYRIISADENFEKLTGYTEKDYREKQLKHTDLIPAEDIVEYIEKMMQIRRNQNENIQEHRLVRKNGDIIVVFCYGKIYKDEKTGKCRRRLLFQMLPIQRRFPRLKQKAAVIWKYQNMICLQVFITEAVLKNG